MFFPPRCAHCNADCTVGSLCHSCRSAFELDCDLPTCRRCGVSVGPHLDTSTDCDRCRTEHYAFESVHRLGKYSGDLASACLKIKHLYCSRLATALTDLLVERRRAEFESLKIDAVMAIPLHWRRRLKRGYDQAEHIGRRLATGLNRPYWTLLRRNRATADQMHISPTERRRNVRNAFSCRSAKRLQGASILLVDDVLTTGSTCHHAAKAIHSAGAAHVHVAVIARGGEG